MARKALRRPGPVLDTNYQNYLISEIEYRDGLAFKKGERIGIIGENGVGKSTFLNINLTLSSQKDLFSFHLF